MGGGKYKQFTFSAPPVEDPEEEKKLEGELAFKMPLAGFRLPISFQSDSDSSFV